MKHVATLLVVLAFASAAYADGAATYAAKCKMCHGAAGEGTKMVPEPITVRARPRPTCSRPSTTVRAR